MKDIKTKEVTTKPKTKNPASRIPKELMRTAILESKEKSQTIANARDNDMGEQSPSEYASGKVASAEEWAARKTGRTVTRAGKTAAQTSYEKIKQRAAGKKEAEKETARGTGDTQTANPASREAQEAQIREVQIQEAQRQKVVSDAVKTKEQKIRAARETPRIQNRQEIAEMKQLSIREQSRKKEAKDTVRQTAIRQKQPETIRIKEKPRKQPEPKTIQKRIIKTAPQSAKISVQPEQKLRAASSNALTARMQKQMERRAAKQAAKKAALQTSDGIRRIQKTARAGENTFKAARATVEVAAKTVQSMMAALGAAGAVIVLLLVIMVGTENGKLYKTNNTVLTTETAWDEIPTSYDDGTAEPLKNIKFIDKNNFVALGTTKAYTGEVVKSIVEPTEAPTEEPTATPTIEPTATPTAKPTDEPKVTPTVNPTDKPEVTPTVNPTDKPEVTPTTVPTATPTIEPTEEPNDELLPEGYSFVDIASNGNNIVAMAKDESRTVAQLCYSKDGGKTWKASENQPLAEKALISSNKNSQQQLVYWKANNIFVAHGAGIMLTWFLTKSLWLQANVKFTRLIN